MFRLRVQRSTSAKLERSQLIAYRSRRCGVRDLPKPTPDGAPCDVRRGPPWLRTETLRRAGAQKVGLFSAGVVPQQMAHPRISRSLLSQHEQRHPNRDPLPLPMNPLDQPPKVRKFFPVGRPVSRDLVKLQFCDPLLHIGPPIVVAPNFFGRVGPAGHEEPKRVAGNVQELAPERMFFLAPSLGELTKLAFAWRSAHKRTMC